MLTVRPLSFTLKHREQEKLKTMMTTTTMLITIIIITENDEDRMVVQLSSRLLLIYNTTKRNTAAAVTATAASFSLLSFSFLSFFLYVYFSTSSNKENSTRFSAIFVLLSVSPHIPTTSISVLSSIYSLFYACLNCMYRCRKRTTPYSLLFFSYQQDSSTYSQEIWKK